RRWRAASSNDAAEPMASVASWESTGMCCFFRVMVLLSLDFNSVGDDGAGFRPRVVSGVSLSDGDVEAGVSPWFVSAFEQGDLFDALFAEKQAQAEGFVTQGTGAVDEDGLIGGQKNLKIGEHLSGLGDRHGDGGGNVPFTKPLGGAGVEDDVVGF